MCRDSFAGSQKDLGTGLKSMQNGQHFIQNLDDSGLQVSNMVSRELEKECIVVFDEAHNIDNVCIEVGRISGCRATCICGRITVKSHTV